MGVAKDSKEMEIRSFSLSLFVVSNQTRIVCGWMSANENVKDFFVSKTLRNLAYRYAQIYFWSFVTFELRNFLWENIRKPSSPKPDDT